LLTGVIAHQYFQNNGRNSTGVLRPLAIYNADRNDSSKWGAFWTDFTSAVNRRDRATLMTMMTSNFEWAGQGNIGPIQAISILDDEMVTWQNILKSVNGGVINCEFEDSTCWNFTGRKAKRTRTSKRLIFELGDDGQWRWVRLIED